jgi:hypothetical protein
MDDKLRAVLEQIERYGELRELGGTRYEKSALLAAASKRRLVSWDKRRNKHELTPAGRKRLADIRAGVRTWPNGLRSAMLIGATLGATGLAAAGLYVDAFRLPFSGPTSAAATTAAVSMLDPDAEPRPAVVPVTNAIVDPAAAAAPVAPRAAAAPDAGIRPQLAKAEEPIVPSAPPARPIDAAPDNGAQPVSAEQPTATEQPAPKARKAHHKWRHAARRRNRNAGINLAFANLNRFAQSLFTPKHSRRR